MQSRPAVLVAAALAIVLALAAPGMAQVSPDRLYYGINRALPMNIQVPDGIEGEPTVELVRLSDGTLLGSASAAPGKVDLAAMFPELWTDAPLLRVAQLKVGAEKVGPPVVLQPMVSPKVATPTRAGINYVQAGNTYSGIRAYVAKDAVLETTEGQIRVRLRPDAAPNSAWNFRHLIEGGYYKDVEIHRIVPKFVIQVGDLTGTGTGGPGYMIDLEESSLKHEYGVVSMARSQNPDSGGSQIFICVEDVNQLDGSYTAFAEVIDGADVMERLEATPVDGAGKAVGETPRLIDAYLVDAAPIGEGGSRVSNPDGDPVER